MVLPLWGGANFTNFAKSSALVEVCTLRVLLLLIFLFDTLMY